MSLVGDGGGGPRGRKQEAPRRGRQVAASRVQPNWRFAVAVLALAAAACGPAWEDERDTASLPVGVEGPGGAASGSAGGNGGAGEQGGAAAGGVGPGANGGAEPVGVGGSGASGSAGGCDASRARWASEVRAVSYGAGAGFGQDAMPGVVLGPPHGAGCCAGSLDVVTLGDGGSIELGFGAAGIADGPGVDFVVFENAFWVAGDSGNVFAEPARVEVSADGIEWLPYECAATQAPWGSCAGWHPVLLDGDVETLDPATAGGDGYDLADVGLAAARFVRIVDRADVGGLAGSFDLDAIGIVHPWCP